MSRHLHEGVRWLFTCCPTSHTRLDIAARFCNAAARVDEKERDVAPPPAERSPYQPGDLVDVHVDGVWRRAEVQAMITTTALSEALRFRVLYGWSDGDGHAPAQHCGPDGHGRHLRPAVQDLPEASTPAPATRSAAERRSMAVGA